MRSSGTSALLLLVLLSGGCGPAPAPVPAPAPAPAPPAAPLPAPPPPRARPAPKAPLPSRPKDEGERLAGLLRLLEWGDADQIRFAEGALEKFPDRAAAADALSAAGLAAVEVNLSYVVNLLGAVPGPDAGRRMEEFLRKAMAVKEGNARQRALRIFARSFPEKAVPVAAERCTDPWPKTALEALRELEGLAGPGTGAALRAVLPRVEATVRPAALAALGRLGDRESIPILAAALEASRKAGEAGYSEGIGAALGLAALGDERGLDALRAHVRALPPDQPAVPLDLDRAEWEGPEVALARARDPALRERLLRQARTAGPEAAAAAVRLLAVEGPVDADALGAFLDALERKDGDAVLWAEALDGLRAAGSRDFLSRAIAALDSPVVDRRYGAALALGRFRDPEAVKPLCDRLAVEADAGVARKICDALGLLGDPRSAPALVRFLKADPAPTPDRSFFAFEAQANLRGPVAAAAAADLAALVPPGPSEAIRFHAARALGHSGVRAHRGVLETLLADPLPSLRIAAADALAELGDPASRDAVALAYAREADEGVIRALHDDILRLDLAAPR